LPKLNDGNLTRAVRVDAEPLQPPLPRRRARDEPLLQLHRCRTHSSKQLTCPPLPVPLSNASQWAPLCRGNLARPASAFGTTTRSEGEKKTGTSLSGHTEADRKIIERVEELAKKHDWKMSHVALAWINKRVSSPIIGFSSVERMDEALEARGKVLSEEEEKYLEELYEVRKIQGHS
jgi:hypothetical protein